MKTPNDGGSARSAKQPSAKQEGWQTISLPVRPEHRPLVDEAMRLAGILLGPGAPDWRKIEAIAVEFLRAYGPPGKRR